MIRIAGGLKVKTTTATATETELKHLHALLPKGRRNKEVKALLMFLRSRSVLRLRTRAPPTINAVTTALTPLLHRKHEPLSA